MFACRRLFGPQQAVKEAAPGQGGALLGSDPVFESDIVMEEGCAEVVGNGALGGGRPMLSNAPVEHECWI